MLFKCIFIMIFVGGSLSDKISVDVYYEPLCWDCKEFIVNQIRPHFDQYREIFDVKFVPYGRAKMAEGSDGSTVFSCQHGPREVTASLIHSCAIEHINKDKSKLIEYISCMVDNEREIEPEIIGRECANTSGVNWETIRNCYEGTEGIKLLNNFRIMTNGLIPSISFVPTVLINNKLVDTSQVLKDLWKVAKSFSTRDIVDVKNEEELTEKLVAARYATLGVLYFYTEKFEAKKEDCKRALGFYKKLAEAEENSNVLFFQMNVDESDIGVTADQVPAFTFITGRKNEELLTSVQDDTELKKCIAERR